jgi:hypothetical protein
MKIIALGDMHCGHTAGLTPPEYMVNKASKPAIRAMQEQCWGWFQRKMKAAGKVDVCICNGDALDGKGDRSGGTEQFEADMLTQAEIAVRCLKEVKADKYLMAHGTPYHCNGVSGEEMERVVARELDAEIHSHYYAKLGGVMFDLRHAIGGSGIPHGRATPLAKEELWNALWAARGQVPKADCLLRSHVHYHAYVGGPGWIAMTLPALQSPGTKFGAKMCSGTVDFGFVEMEVSRGRIDRWQADVVVLQNIAEVVVVQ